MTIALPCEHPTLNRTADGLSWCHCGSWFGRDGKAVVHVPRSQKRKKKRFSTRRDDD